MRRGGEGLGLYNPRILPDGKAVWKIQGAAIKGAADGLTDPDRAAIELALGDLDGAIRGFADDHGKRVVGLGSGTLLEIFGAIGIRMSRSDQSDTEE